MNFATRSLVGERIYEKITVNRLKENPKQPLCCINVLFFQCDELNLDFNACKRYFIAFKRVD